MHFPANILFLHDVAVQLLEIIGIFECVYRWKLSHLHIDVIIRFDKDRDLLEVSLAFAPASRYQHQHRGGAGDPSPDSKNINSTHRTYTSYLTVH